MRKGQRLTEKGKGAAGRETPRAQQKEEKTQKKRGRKKEENGGGNSSSCFRPDAPLHTRRSSSSVVRVTR